MDNKDLCEHTRIRLIAAALGHQQCTKTDGTEVLIPGTDKRILIGGDAYLAKVALPVAPASAQPAEPKRRDIFAICDAYESGMGHGLQRDCHKSGAIFGNPEHGMAYEIGYEEGERRAASPATVTAPAPDEARVDDIVTALYRRFKDWSKRGFGPNDVTWCEVKADVLNLIATVTEPAAPADKIEEIRALLQEVYGFASTSPRGQENINAALDLLDEINAAPEDDQEWDRNAARLTSEMGLGGGKINPDATSILDLFVDDDAPAAQQAAPTERDGWNAAAKALSERAAGHDRMGNWTEADECRQCASMLHDMKPAAAPATAGMVGQDAKDAARYRHLRNGKWFEQGFAKTEPDASAFHYAGELLDSKVDAALAAQQAQASAKEGDQA